MFVYTRYAEVPLVILIVSFKSFPCPENVAYNVYTQYMLSLHLMFCHSWLNLKQRAQWKHPKLGKYKRGVCKSGLRSVTFGDPLRSERLPIIRFLNTAIDVAGGRLWGTLQSSWEQYDSSRQERQAVITQRNERLSWREIAPKSLWTLWLSVSNTLRNWRLRYKKKKEKKLQT